MNKQDLKKALYPLIKEILLEMIEKDSSIPLKLLKESLQLSQQMISVEKPEEESKIFNINQKQTLPAREKQQLQESKKKLLDAIGVDAYKGVFEGLQPLPSAGSIAESAPTPSSAHGPLAGLDPNDRGIPVDIIPGADRWKHTAFAKKK